MTPAAVFATENAAEIGIVSSGYLVRLTFGLVLIVAIIFFIAWVLKRSNLTRGSTGGVIRVIAGMALGTRDRLVVVQVGEEQLLLGLSPGKIQKLHVLQEPLDIDEPSTGLSSFARKLSEANKNQE